MLRIKIEVKFIMKRRLKKRVVYGMYVVLFVSVLYMILSIDVASSPSVDDVDYVSKTIVSEDIPVVAVNNVIKRPYSDSKIRIVSDYYDFKEDASEQLNSIILFEDTYLQNSGVSYVGEGDFEVLSILDGVVLDVSENDLLGNIISIDHGNGIIAYYQSVSDIVVKQGDLVSCGSVIAHSGVSNISKDLGSHLNFELSINGILVNPENYYDHNISDIVG